MRRCVDGMTKRGLKKGLLGWRSGVRVLHRKQRAAEVLISMLADFLTRCQLHASSHWSNVAGEQGAKEQRLREALHRLNERLAGKLGQAERAAMSRWRASVAHSRMM